MMDPSLVYGEILNMAASAHRETVEISDSPDLTVWNSTIARNYCGIIDKFTAMMPWETSWVTLTFCNAFNSF